jgi:hypothetical protein
MLNGYKGRRDAIRKIKRLGLKRYDPKPSGVEESCPFVRGDLYVNPKSPKVKIMILSEPESSIRKYFGYCRVGWQFEALILRDGKAKLEKTRRVWHDEMKTFLRLEAAEKLLDEKSTNP